MALVIVKLNLLQTNTIVKHKLLPLSDKSHYQTKSTYTLDEQALAGPHQAIHWNSNENIRISSHFSENFLIQNSLNENRNQ